jgi:tetratricopeptide (TPR) repeat protein
MLLMGAAGAYLGFMVGIRGRLAREEAQSRALAEQHFQKGVHLLDAGDSELARAYFEYVLSIDPGFPGAREQYNRAAARLEEALAITSTPDDNAARALFNLAAGQIRSKAWGDALDTLEALRNLDLAFRPVEVDGLYFNALRHQGVVMFAEQGNLEGALYLFLITSQYAPLDRAAASYTSWARLYLTAASFWELDWEQAARYFGMLYSAYPSMHDGGWTAARRFMVASEMYGDKLMEARDPCGALEQYQNALDAGADGSVQPKFDQAFNRCYPPTATPRPPTATPTPPDDTPDATPETPPPDTDTPPPPEETPPGDTPVPGEGG